jgi:D-alanyl-D-alanine carboxypeptidase
MRVSSAADLCASGPVLLSTTLLAIVLGAAPHAAMAISSRLTDTDRARVDAAMNHLVEAGVPGIELAVVKDGILAYTQGYGLADLKTKRPLTADTPMEIGSLTMQFTAAAILQLAESGKISLDDKLGKYVPEYILGRDITLRHLLKLQGGVPDYFWQDEVSGRIFTQKPSVDRVLNLFEDHKLEFAPGTRWASNNSEYFLLGQVIERVTGMHWETYVKRNIFARAGMTHTTTIAHEPELRDFPVGYWRMNSVIGNAPRPYDLWGLATFNVVSTVGDIANWTAALQSGEIVNRDNVALMMNPGLLDNGEPTPLHTGMAFRNTALEERPMVWNDGGTLGFTGINAIFPDERLQLIVLSNANITIVYPSPLLNAAFFALHPDLEARRFAPAPGEDMAITAKVRNGLQAIRAGTLGADQIDQDLGAGMDELKQFLEQKGDIESLIFKGQKAYVKGTSYDYRVRFARGDFLFNFVLDSTSKFADIHVAP